MMRQLSALSEREQDSLFYNTLERLKSKDLSNLLAMLYLRPRTKLEIRECIVGYTRAIDAVTKLREAGVSIKYKDKLYWLTGMDDGEPVGMVIKNDIRTGAMA